MPIFDRSKHALAPAPQVMPSADCVHQASISTPPLGSLQLLTPQGTQSIVQLRYQLQGLLDPYELCLKPDGSLRLTAEAGARPLWTMPPSLPGVAPFTALVRDCEVQVGWFKASASQISTPHDARHQDPMANTAHTGPCS